MVCSHLLSGVLPGWQSCLCSLLPFIDALVRTTVQWNMLGSWCSWELPQTKKMPRGEVWKGAGELCRAPPPGTSHPGWAQSSNYWDMALCANQTYYSLCAKTYSWVSASIALGYVFHWLSANAKCYSPTCLTHKLLIFFSLGLLNLACF